MITKTILATVAATAIVAASASAQSPQRPAFEAATIKLADTRPSPLPVMPSAPNRLRIPSKTLTLLIYEAYGDGGYNTGTRVTGGPDWVSKTAFFIEGVAAGPATRQQMRLMLQTLLEERFALKISNETTTADMLTLVVDRADGVLGPKLRKWDGTCPAVMPPIMFPAARRPLQRPAQQVGDRFVVPAGSDADDPETAYCPTGYRVGGIIADGVRMSTVASLLSLPPARELLGGLFTTDQTGLTARYTADLDFVFPPPPDYAGPALSTVVREQWGLRLVPGKGTFRTIRVDSARLPTTD
jgi:uncharacterized protein (TIGR03435 family)